MTEIMKKIDVSVIVTCHQEGILAHKTMLSIFKSAETLDKNGLSYEVVVHIDNGDSATKEYFKRYADDSRVVVLNSQFKDLSLSRNFAISKSQGEYVTCIDADDLYSESWLMNAYQTVKNNMKLVARFNYLITFGSEDTIATNNTDISSLDQLLYLIASNMYGSSFFCHRSIYEETQQRSNVAPYGSEDWQWTLDTMAKGVVHTVAPETVYFYRKDVISKPSLLTNQAAYRAILSPTKLLGFDEINKIDIPEKMISTENEMLDEKPESFIKQKIYNAFVYANTFKTYRLIRDRLRPKPPEDIPEPAVQLPEWLLSEWKKINRIEKATFPSDYILLDVTEWMPNKQVGVQYVNIIKSLKKQPDTLFFVPWLIRGGADKVFINTANEIAKNHPTWKMAFIQTYPHDSVWQDKLSEGIDFSDISKFLQGLNYDAQMSIMAILVSQNNIKRILIGNSRFAYDFVHRYKTLIRHMDIKVYMFAFTETISHEGRIGDYIHECIPFVQDVAYRIVTDNTSIVEQLYQEHAIPKEKVFVHHQFLSNSFEKPRITDNKPLRVLWASRINSQKIPEVLRDIGKNLSQDFTIDVYGQLENNYTESFFDQSNINYIRAFDGVDDLPITDYDIFCYTSNADGMPNMLLEIASKGLPIVAPDVGGIKDFIKDKQTGILVKDCMDVDEYLEALESLKDSELRKKIALNAQEELRLHFNKPAWELGVKRIFNK